MFRGIDTDNSGTITLEELKHGLAKQGTKLSEYEVKQLMEAVSSLFYFIYSLFATLYFIFKLPLISIEAKVIMYNFYKNISCGIKGTLIFLFFIY